MEPERKHRWKSRLGLFGDIPTRLMLLALQVTPWFLEPILIASWTLVFYTIARSHRRAVAGNLQALHPHWKPWQAHFGAFQVFWNFALTFVDAQRGETRTGSIDWALDGQADLELLAKHSQGCILLTAHMGNYDLAASLFASRFKRTLYTVRAPEREPENQRLRDEEIRRKEALNPQFRSLYNRDGNLLGIELARLLAEGNIVAVQGDRVIFDVSPMEVEVEPGLSMTLPKGPLFLARATGAPCFPLFIVRDGWRRYRVLALPEIQLPPRKRGSDAEAAQLWAATLLTVIRHHWRQWYVFEPLLTRRPAEIATLSFTARG